MDETPNIGVKAGASRAAKTARGDIGQESYGFGIWQELERALSIVHVAGLELVAEIEVGGEQPESITRQKFEEALKEFHDVLSVLGILPASLRLTAPSED
jgi:hypothetical protein